MPLVRHAVAHSHGLALPSRGTLQRLSRRDSGLHPIAPKARLNRTVGECVRLKVFNLNIAPFIFEILRHQATVTVVRLVFTAKETASVQCRLVDILDLSVEELFGINGPCRPA